MRTIHKFPLDITDTNRIEIPGFIELINLGCDPLYQLCLYAMVNTSNKNVITSFDIRVVGTGNTCDTALDNGYEYYGTTRIRNGVWHVFIKYHNVKRRK